MVRKNYDLENYWTQSTRMQLFTDTTGPNGWDAYWNGRWIIGRWSEVQLKMDITCHCHSCPYLGVTVTETIDITPL